MSTHLAPLTMSKTDRKTVQQAYKQERDRRIAERMQCVLWYAEGRAVLTIRRLLLVGIKTLKNWIQTFAAQGLEGLRTWRYRGQACLLTDTQWAEVDQELARTPYRRAREVATWIAEQFGVVYSERGMQALLRRKGYRYIKTRLVPGTLTEAKQREQHEWVQHYEHLKATLGPCDRVYHVDAVHPTHTVQLTYVWTQKGFRRRINSNPGRTRYNILGAYCPDDHEYLDIRGTENVNAATLQALIDKIRRRHPDATRLVLILDNARYNHAKLVREHIEDTAVELDYLPSYSPNLNLIERLWRLLRSHVMTTYYDSFERFVEAIAQILDHLHDYAEELATLMTEKFEILACV